MQSTFTNCEHIYKLQSMFTSATFGVTQNRCSMGARQWAKPQTRVSGLGIVWFGKAWLGKGRMQTDAPYGPPSRLCACFV